MRRQNVEKAYGCILFDSRKDGVRKLIDHLSSVLVGMAPVNRPALSLFVAPSADVKENAFAFFKEIGNQAKMAKNRCGAWVELLGSMTGRCRSTWSVSATAWPFYGLQEVTPIRCTAADGREALIEACRRRCRSSHFVFVDTWQALPADFVMSALAAQRAGVGRVLQYEICSTARVIAGAIATGHAGHALPPLEAPRALSCERRGTPTPARKEGEAGVNSYLGRRHR